jgi:DNA repair protein RecO (recombination protein O)
MKRKCLAIPIRTVDYSNSSQVVALFTREDGLVEGIAKGAHREKSSFQGPFDLAVLYEAVYLVRQSSGLGVLTEAAVLDGLRGIRRQWRRHAAASHVLELLRAVAVAGEPEPELFDLVLESLRLLEGADDARCAALLARFDAASLRILGLLAPMDACVECGLERPPGLGVHVSPSARGILCRRCREAGHGGRGVTLPAPALAILERFSCAPVEPPDWEELGEAWHAHGKRVVEAVSGLRTVLLERELVALKSCRGWV